MKGIGPVILATLLAFTSATAQQGAYASIEVAEGVYSFGGGPYGYYTMFVVSDDGVLVADPVNPDLAKAMLQEIRGITTQPIRTWSIATITGIISAAGRSSKMPAQS